ncbi:hypothetical protein EOD41_13835 [Mucilaginibacter limnophilus]|uniref:Uncharacterized protein n=1 Tax=Mucilaginibacter limnophilus TaxID=1932778 RepID=A0A3S2VLI3_9SPHI|nr:hypothetical protein [Mucilaginibacter limnophilus]RVU00040.1 hypothetical protein EOD41_13835 [Mucilaginibacter limnophilus]
MRYPLPLFILFLAVACTGPTKQLNKTAQHNAQKYLQNYLTDFSSYKPVSFSKLDSIMESHLNNEEYIRLDDSVMEMEAIRFRDMGEDFKLYKQRETTGWYTKKQNNFKHLQDSIARKVKPRFSGYKLEHEFMAADTTGKSTLNNYIFCFDEEGRLLKVIK